ncbi:MAG: radical SAM protein [Planctomycetes bacterium]|nr:radical SAM protein [Planctomycetota bacterium]
MRLSLVLTHQCDLACSYCYTGRKVDRAMPLATGRRAIDRAVAGLTPGEPLELSLFGGEPLLEWPLARALLHHAHARAARAGAPLLPVLTTNGTRLDAEVLGEALDLGVRLAVSMDGLPEVHDAARPRRGGRPSSAAALAAIDLLVARRAPFAVVSVVRPASLDRLVEGARALVARGVAHLAPTLDMSAPWREDDLPRLRAAVRELRDLQATRPGLHVDWLDAKAWSLLHGRPAGACGVGQGEVAVAPSGRLYPCERLVGEDPPGDPLAFGRVDDGDGPFPALSRPAPGEATCDGCATRPHCQHGCACANLARTGALDRPDGLVCALERACLDEALALVRAAGAEVVAPAAGRTLPLARREEVARVGP